eukprot:COSAG01_NODE_9273_length_2496_cov_2.047559_1_plen_123_part_00
MSGRFHIFCGRFDWDLPMRCVFLSRNNGVETPGAASQLAELERHLHALSPPATAGAGAGADDVTTMGEGGGQPGAAVAESTAEEASGGGGAPMWLKPWALVSFLATANSWVYVPEAAPLVRA